MEHSPVENKHLEDTLHKWSRVVPKLLGFMVGILITLGFLQALYKHYLPFHLPHSTQLLERLNIGGEYNAISWFSSGLLLSCALLSAIIASVSSQQKRTDIWHWWGISAVLVAMSADETLSMHEMLMGPMNTLIHPDGYYFYSWVLVAIPLLAVSLLILRPMLTRLPRLVAQRLLFAAAVYFGGAVGIEMISGKIREIYVDWSLIRPLCGALEECMEMTGLVLGISSLMFYLQEILSDKAATQASS